MKSSNLSTLSAINLSTPSISSPDDSTGLLSMLFTAKGWEDPSAKIQAAEVTDLGKQHYLNDALRNYTLAPDLHRGQVLMETFLEIQTGLKAEYTYAKKQQTLYQHQADTEAKITGSSIADWTQWVWHGVQEFFGSTNEALVDKYVKMAKDCQSKQNKLSVWIENLQQEIQLLDERRSPSTSRHLLQQGEEPVVVQKYIQDQTINIGQPYFYSLDGIFSGDFDLFDALVTSKSTSSNWLNIQYQLVGNMQSGYEILDMCVSDNFLIVGGAQLGLTIYNISNPSTPHFLSQSNTGNPRDSTIYFTTVENNTIFVLNDYGDILIFDLNDPVKLPLLSRYSTGSYLNAIAVAANNLFVGTHNPRNNTGLFILDVTTLTSPQLLSSFEISVDIIAIKNHILVIGSGPYIEILDVSNSSAPTLLSRYNSGYEYATDLAFSDDIHTVFIATSSGINNNGLIILNITNPNVPKLLNSFPEGGSLAVLGNLLFMTNQGLIILDVSNPNTPRLIGGYNDNIQEPNLIALTNQNMVLITDVSAGLLIINISQGYLVGTPQGTVGQTYSITLNARSISKNLASTTFVLTLNEPFYRIETSLPDQNLFPGDLVYLPLNLDLIFENPENSFLGLSLQLTNNQPLPSWISLTATLNTITQYNISEFTLGLVALDNTLFLLQANNSLVQEIIILDVSAPSTPQWVGKSQINLVFTRSISLLGNILIIGGYDPTWSSEGIEIFNITVPKNPQILAKYNTSTGIAGITIWNNLVILAEQDQGIEIVDITRPNVPQKLCVYNTTGPAQNTVISGGIAYVTNYDRGLAVIDINNPSTPNLLAIYDIDTYRYQSVAISGDTLVITTQLGLDIFDVSTPSNPQRIISYWMYVDGSVGANEIILMGNTLIAYGVEFVILDLSVPSSPRVLTSYSVKDSVGMVISGDTLFIAGTNQNAELLGIQITQWQFNAKPNVSDVGNYAMSLVASDALGGSASDIFTIRVEGPPQISGRIPLQYAPVGQTYIYFSPQGLFTDPNLDPISFTAMLSDGSLLPQWLQFSSSGIFIGNPKNTDSFNITIGATDYIAGITNTSFILFVGNPIPNPPVLRGNRTFTFQVPTSTFEVGDGSSRQYSSMQTTGESLPEWLTFNNETLQFQGMSLLNIINLYTLNLNVIATDDQNDVIIAPLSFTIIQNSPLEINPISTQTATVGDYFNFFVPVNTFFNPNGYPLTLFASQVSGADLPEWLLFNSNNESTVFMGTPGYADTNFYSLRRINIQLAASDGIVNGTTLFTIEVGGMSYMQLAVTTGSPLISIIAAIFTLYELRALLLNRCRKERYTKDRRDCSEGQEIKINFTTPRASIKEVSLRKPPEKAMFNCCQFFKLPSLLPGGTLLPRDLNYCSGDNILEGRIPKTGEQKLFVQVSGKLGLILEQYELNIVPHDAKRVRQESERSFDYGVITPVHEEPVNSGDIKLAAVNKSRSREGQKESQTALLPKGQYNPSKSEKNRGKGYPKDSPLHGAKKELPVAQNNPGVSYQSF